MADNVGYTEGAGKTIAAEEILGILFQRIKLVLGADGVNGGDVSLTNPLPSLLVDAVGNAIDPRVIRAIASGTDSITVPNVDVLLSTRATEATLLTRAADATLTGGTAKSIVRGGQKGATNTNADLTHTAEGADHEALDVQIYHGGAAKDPTAIRALTASDVVSAAGTTAHDGAGAAVPPLAAGAYASAAAPADVNADADIVRLWALRNGALVFNLASGGTLVTLGQKVMASSMPVVLASDQTVIPVNGDVDHDAANTLKNIQIAGNANPCDVPPTAVSANGDRVRGWMDKYGAFIIRRRKIRESYTAVFRLAEAAARLDQTFTHVANTNKQWMTLHHTAASTKELRLTRWVIYITAFSAASQAILELRQLSVTTAPATGNPAITPTPRRQAGGAAEAVALYLPTTQGSELAVNSPIASRVYDLGIFAAASAANPMAEVEIVLYDASRDDDEILPPTFPLGAYAGLAVMLRTVGTPAVRMTGVATFTEEIV